MNIKFNKPEFKIVEVNNLTGLRIGHVMAQRVAKVADVAHTTYGTQDVLENGVVVGLDADGTIKNFAEGVPFLVYLEPLIDGYHVGADQQGEAFDENGEVYPRAVALYAGDTFTTNNYDAGEVADTVDTCFAKVVNGVLALQVTETGASFIAERTTLATGDEAFKFTYLARELA